MKFYKASFNTYNDGVEEVEISGHTEKTVFWISKSGHKHREYKESSYYFYNESKKLCINWIIDKHNEKIDNEKRRINRLRNSIDSSLLTINKMEELQNLKE